MKQFECSSCHETKDEIHFTRNKNTRTGYSYQCKKCMAEYRRNHRRKKRSRQLDIKVAMAQQNLQTQEPLPWWLWPDMKKCAGCKKERPVSEFPPLVMGKDGLGPRCRKCVNQYHREYYRKKKLGKRSEAVTEDPVPSWLVPVRRCAGCHQEKPVTEFYRSRYGKDGRHPKCKDCVNAYQKKYIENRKKSVDNVRTM